jgi:ComF family protein
MRELGRELLDLLLPPACVGCRRSVARGAVLCGACDLALPRIPRCACTVCQEAAAGALAARCSGCEEARAPLAACCAAVWFEGAAAAWVKRFKYAAPGLTGLDPAAEAVCLALAGEAAERMPRPLPGAIVPVPLHPARIRARGFQPAGVLAHALSRRLGVPLLPRLLARVRDTPSQTGRGRADRQRNVTGCFEAAPAASPPPTVWLVDDVVTTGATLGEAARALRRAGAGEVGAVCLARTPAPPR